MIERNVEAGRYFFIVLIEHSSVFGECNSINVGFCLFFFSKPSPVGDVSNL